MLHDIRWSSERFSKVLELVEAQVYRKRIPLPPFSYYELENPIGPSINSFEFDKSEAQVIGANSAWGGVDINFILRTEFRIPNEWFHDIQLGLYIPIGIAGDFSHPEALTYIDGVPYAAVDRHHQEVLLPKTLTRDSLHDLILHGWTGSLSQGKVHSLSMGDSCLVVVDQATRSFLSLARIALGIADQLERNDPIRAQLLTSMNQAFSLLDTREPMGENFYASIPDYTNLCARITLNCSRILKEKLITTSGSHWEVCGLKLIAISPGEKLWSDSSYLGEIISDSILEKRSNPQFYGCQMYLAFHGACLS